MRRLKHIVMWKFKTGTDSQRREFLDGLRALDGQIESIRSMEISENQLPSGDCDAVLVATFDDEAGLNAYKTDPRHLAVSALCKSIREARHAVDYYIEE